MGRLLFLILDICNVSLNNPLQGFYVQLYSVGVRHPWKLSEVLG